MRVGVGWSEHPDTAVAGREASLRAVEQAGRDDPCDVVLLFSTARHDARALRSAVTSVLGESMPIVGGGAVGVIANDYFGYAGDQVILAAFWLETARCELLYEGGLAESERETGRGLGKQLAACGVKPDSHVVLFYDAIDGTFVNGVRTLMATPLLEGMEESLGFLPDVVGAGMQGDYLCTPIKQWTGAGITEHHASCLLFSGKVRVDSAIMHGCRPATGYYTVTKAEGQAILEINGRPALSFMSDMVDGLIPPEAFPFFLIFGVNNGGKWEEFDENNYASRLCLAIDRERDAIIMFEPDMVAGTEFQIMYRSLDLEYMKPRIEALFEGLEGRTPVFALYIDCAGRAAGYGGIDMEDAVVVQKTVDGRVPLLGIYSGVEIASVRDRPRGLDWTGVFCLFSISS